MRRHDLAVPPLRSANGNYAEAMTWAFEAFSQGIWNVPAAPSGKAWQFWIWAWEGRCGRNRLMRFGAQLAERDAFAGSRGAMGRDGGEQAAYGKTAGSDDGEDPQPNVAERVFESLKSMDLGLMDAPFPIDDESEVPPREIGRPPTRTVFPGAF